MNTIYRARVHPRVSSVNFRTFFWLLRREAVRQVLYLPVLDALGEQRVRVLILKEDGRKLLHRAARRLGVKHVNGRH